MGPQGRGAEALPARQVGSHHGPGGLGAARIFQGSSPPRSYRRGLSGGPYLLPAGVLVAVALVVVALLAFPPTSRPGTQTVTLAITPGASPGSVAAYSTSHVAVRAGTVVTFVITNYDPEAAPSPSPMALQVAGTVGNTASYQFAPTSSAVRLAGLGSNDVAHTFSMDFGSFILNVPIPPAHAAGMPSVVTFQVAFSTVGSFAWYCDVPCGTMPMMAPGPMGGFVEVGG